MQKAPVAPAGIATAPEPTTHCALEAESKGGARGENKPKKSRQSPAQLLVWYGAEVKPVIGAPQRGEILHSFSKSQKYFDYFFCPLALFWCFAETHFSNHGALRWWINCRSWQKPNKLSFWYRSGTHSASKPTTMVKLVTLLALPGILILLCTLVNASTSVSHLHHDQGSCYSDPSHYANRTVTTVRLIIHSNSIGTDCFNLICWQVYRRSYRKWPTVTSSTYRWSR